MSKIIAVNAGSSSLKFSLFEMPAEEVICSGAFERIGMDDAIFTIKHNGEKKKTVLPIKTHNVAVDILLKSLVEEKVIDSLKEISGVGHRILHGGEYFSESAILNDEEAAKIETLTDLGPLHIPANLTGYRVFKDALPGVGHVGVFDTAFHKKTMKEDRYLYPIPYEYYEQFKVRKYGFHGTSHLFVSQRCIELLGNPEHSKIITCHIGNGASLAAVKDGNCIDTSMGITPLGGVMMGTRSGDLDPAVVSFLADKLNKKADEVVTILNKKSGYLGVSGISSDARDVFDAAEQGNERAILTRKMHCNTVANFIGSYFVELGGCDAIVFTAGLGENDASFRQGVIDKVSEALGVSIDPELNKKRGEEILISTPESKIKVYVIPTNEELVIARDTQRLLKL